MTVLSSASCCEGFRLPEISVSIGLYCYAVPFRPGMPYARYAHGVHEM